MSSRPILPETEPVLHWLGLGPLEPEGLHGHKRKRFTLRHTRLTRIEGGRLFHQAMVRTYPLRQEHFVMSLLRPQRLDDALWRRVFTLMAQGGPLMLPDLVKRLELLTSPSRAVVQEEAVRLYRRWWEIQLRLSRRAPVGAE